MDYSVNESLLITEDPKKVQLPERSKQSLKTQGTTSYIESEDYRTPFKKTRPSNLVSKFLKNTVNASANEVLAASDVTIESRKALRNYSLYNFTAFSLEGLAIIALQVHWIGEKTIFDLHINIDSDTLPIVPVYVNNIFINVGWLIALALQLFYVIRGLPCLNPGQHYVNCLVLKIKFWFTLLCFIMTTALVTFSYTIDTKISYFVMIPLFSLILLKCK